MTPAKFCFQLSMIVFLVQTGISIGEGPYNQLSMELFQYQVRLKDLPPAQLARVVEQAKAPAKSAGAAAEADAQVQAYVAQLKAYERLTAFTDAELSRRFGASTQRNYWLSLAWMGLGLGWFAFALVEPKVKPATVGA